MGGAASCLPLADPGPEKQHHEATVVYQYQTPAPAAAPHQAGTDAAGAPHPASVRLASAYASRPGTTHAPDPLSAGQLTKAFAARRQPLKPNQDSILVRPSYGGCTFMHAFAVFDGHGSDGGAASRFAKDKMEALMLQELRSRAGGDLARVVALSTDAVTAALRAAFLGTERALGHTLEVDDSFSGTTAVVVLLIGCRLFAASVGDSRAVLGRRTGDDGNGASTVAVGALTWDHNPYRAEELERVKRAGGVVMNYEEMAAYGSQGAVTAPSWQTQLQHEPGPASGAPVFSLDPPRVWDRGLTKPGCCFTRSLGDSFSKTLGVIAEPEMTCRDLVGEFVL